MTYRYPLNERCCLGMRSQKFTKMIKEQSVTEYVQSDVCVFKSLRSDVVFIVLTVDFLKCVH